MNIYKHIVFNPHLESIETVINRLGPPTVWYLSHVVPCQEYVWIAVFEAWDSEGDDQAVLGKMPVIDSSLTPPKQN
jgi:hypothetical protein